MEIMENIKLVITSDNYQDVLDLFENNYPIDIASSVEELEDDEFIAFINKLKAEELALLIEESEEEQQYRILNLMDNDKIISIFDYMSPDDITDILGMFKVSLRKEILGKMRSGDSATIKRLLSHDKETAGGIMTTQYIALRETLTVKDALNKIRIIGPRTEVIETIFIMDEKYRLTGTVDLRDIFTSLETTVLKEIMDSEVISVLSSVDQEEVALLVSKYDLKAIPVVNSKNVILGIITVDDIIDVIIEEQTEDMLKISGVDKDERIDNTVLESVKSRLPWLLINLATAFIASATVSAFEDVINKVVALAAAMTIITGMGGNAGSQTLSVMIRSIALGKVDLKEDWSLVIKEICLGLIDGLVTGVIAGAVLYFHYKNIWLGVIIVMGMVANLVIAGFAGFLIPLLLKKLNFDPAISSSIFLTTATDVGGFFIFLGLARLFLPLIS